MSTTAVEVGCGTAALAFLVGIVLAWLYRRHRGKCAQMSSSDNPMDNLSSGTARQSQSPLLVNVDPASSDDASSTDDDSAAARRFAAATSH
eukprot:CAMPEP_0182945628 /NCGR_PEP_ID=MMETSP0105_2-20130417/55799_1 /TAXON_ID=81532 ORGANISM="Acanthoeca-like sp., Strain 10tr" /NCGR_SAMPLE_ID=MMETSP0105_2 /ASSEMBLY_ACC=CAM_ASM_000205 /LENGTH=90 /DNA_ID=CAMNT_0025085669 /DNA_START=12 /DNA_END=281 /DNA_ORIENTATION=-